MVVIWTPKARRSYFEIIDHLEKTWTEREIRKFISDVDHLLVLIKQNPEIGEESGKRKDVRKCLITKQSSLYYRIKPHRKELQLLLFWDNRQDPEKLDY